MNGGLVGDAETLAALRADGIEAVRDVLARADLVRDLPDRSNHRLRVGGSLVHVKRRKRATRSDEAAMIARANAAGVETARIAFQGADAVAGALVGTFDLAPARPLDALLREERLPAVARRPLLVALARAVARLHDAGLFPRDLYLGHVYVDPDGAPPLAPTFIDLERAARAPLLRGVAAVRELAALLASVPDGRVTTRETLRLLVAYARARGIPPPSPRAIARKAARIRRHVPRTSTEDRTLRAGEREG